MKEENIDERIERVIESVGSKKQDMRQWEIDRLYSENRHNAAMHKRRVYGISAAASIVAIIGIGMSLLSNHSTGMDPYLSKSTPVYRGGSNETAEIAEMIASANYKEALMAIEASLGDTLIDPSFSPERQEYLRSINANREYELTWLKIQALAQSGNTEEAISLLNDYILEEGIHQEDAKKFLKEL